MAKSSATHAHIEDLHVSGIKRAREDGTVDLPSKKVKFLLENEGSDKDSDDSTDGGAQIDQNVNGFKINEEYARRFEHNKKRDELHRC